MPFTKWPTSTTPGLILTKSTPSFLYCIKLGHNDVHGRLGGRVQSICLNLEIIDQVEVGVAAGNSDDLLDLALQDKREEEVEEVDVADNIGLE